MALGVQFYRSETGAEPVREWMTSECSKADRKAVGEDLRYVQAKYPTVGLPTWRPLGAGLYEVRTNLTGSRTARVLVCVTGGYIVMLHAFVKKTQKTPAGEIEIARRRMREVRR